MTLDMPSQERLRADVGRTFLLTESGGQQRAARLTGVYDSIPMSRRYCCYGAEFAVLDGSALPQAVYDLSIGEEHWSLLMAPIGPNSDGLFVLEAVFHYLLSQPTATAAS